MVAGVAPANVQFQEMGFPVVRSVKLIQEPLQTVESLAENLGIADPLLKPLEIAVPQRITHGSFPSHVRALEQT